MSSSTSTKPLSARCDRDSGRDRTGPPRRSGRLLRQGAREAELAQALERILADRDTDTETQLRRLRETGLRHRRLLPPTLALRRDRGLATRGRRASARTD